MITPVQFALFAAALYNLVLVVLILQHTRANRAGRNFAWFILTNAAWNLCVGIMQFPQVFPSALWLARATFAIATFMGISGLWFCADFPQSSRRFRYFAFWLTVLGLPWLICAWFPEMIIRVSREPWGVKADVGMLVMPFTIWIFTCIVVSVVHLLYKARKLRGLDRQQVRFVLLGIIGLAIAGTITNLVLPSLYHDNRYAPLGGLASLFVTTTSTYAIVRYRLLDIRFVLRAGLIYSLTLGVLSLLFALLVPLLEQLLTHSLLFPSGIGSFLMAFFIALGFQPLRRQVQHWVDQRFFKSVYDFQLTLREAGKALAAVRDRDQLVAILMDALTRALRPRGLAVYLPGRAGTLTRVACLGAGDLLPDALANPESVLLLAHETDDVMLTEELVRQSDGTIEIGRRLHALEVAVAVPLIAGDRLSGLVLLGEKLSGDMYTAGDIGLLRILGKQAAVALDNARHYDEMVLMNEYHARLLQTMQDGVIALDPQQRILTFNPAAEGIFGVAAVAAIGKRLGELGITQLPIEAITGQARELTITTSTGSIIPALVTVTPFIRRWEVAQSHLVVVRDLSALRALEQEKVQAERFSSMGAMAASLAHEIKNPLVPIKMFAHLLPTRYDDEEFRQEFSHTVVNEVERINRLVGQMLDLVRKPSAEHDLVDMRELIERLLVLMRAECEHHHVRVQTRFAPDLPAIFGMPGQLYQSVMNILVNAIQAMTDGGDLYIELTSNGSTLTCRISDTGPGVAADELSRIFEPLYTTKAEGHGLGLALTYQFIRAHGGEVRADHRPGGGLSIVLTLPVRQAREAELLCS